MAICRRISEWTTANWCWLDEEEQIGRLNRMMVGWSNYFCLGPINPIEGSIPMPGNGSVSGCDGSTSCSVGVTHASPTNTCMTS